MPSYREDVFMPDGAMKWLVISILFIYCFFQRTIDALPINEGEIIIKLLQLYLFYYKY